MKVKSYSVLAFIISLFCSTAFSQELGEKVYKEVEVNGEKVFKWLVFAGIEEYNSKGKVTHDILISKGEKFEKWYKYDDNENLIYEKTSYGKEKYYEYDNKNNLVHEQTHWGYSTEDEHIYYEYNENNHLVKEMHCGKLLTTEVFHTYNVEGEKIYTKDTNGYEASYEYDENGNLIKQTNSYGKGNSNEFIYKYDSKGNLIYSFIMKLEFYYEYDNNGNQIYFKNNSGNESWIEYEYYPDGKIKTQKRFNTF